MVYKRLRGGLPLNKNLLSTPSPLPGCYVSMSLGPAHKCCFKQDFEFSRRVTVIFRFELYTVAYKLKLPAKYGESCFTRFNFFEIRSESLNKSAMSCCSFVGIYCCVYTNVMNSVRVQFLVGCYYGAESETSSVLKSKILICHWLQKNAKLKL